MPHTPRNRDKMPDVDAKMQATCLDSGHKGAYVRCLTVGLCHSCCRSWQIWVYNSNFFAAFSSHRCRYPLSFVITWRHCRATLSLCIVAHRMSSCIIVICRRPASSSTYSSYIVSGRLVTHCVVDVDVALRHALLRVVVDILPLCIVVVKWQSRPLFSE